jgi:hypothetical protein
MKYKGDAAVTGTKRINMRIAYQQAVTGLRLQCVNRGEQG